MVDIRQTKEYASYLKKTGWIVERTNETNYFIKKIPLLGAFIKIQRPESLRYEDIKILSEKYRAFQVVIEPKNRNQELRIRNYGFKLSKSPYLPTKTIHLDLTQSKEKLLGQMKKDARYAVRKTQNSKLNPFGKLRVDAEQSRSIKTQNIENIEEFRNSWKKSVGLKRYVPPLSHLTAFKKTFGENSLFLLASSSQTGLPRRSKDEARLRSQSFGEAEAGAIFLIGDEVAYYWQAFTSKVGRKTLSQYKIVWEGILWAKSSGAELFDFEGIYDKRFPNKKWLGFTHFKKSFGGYEVEHPGAYTKLFLFDTIRSRLK